MSQALYRKYRPRTFDDLVGQDAVSTTLKNQARTGRTAHAYLFCGSRGTGKTSTARIMAKAVNCLEPDGGNPCCECDICQSVQADRLPDVIEIDAASNSGVDNIRELREQSHFTPTVARRRVYIIDEVHMLSQGAFNALLKIMEEPPAHIMFILATTEIYKVPATILSRCQRFDFYRIQSEVIAAQLLYVAGAESISLDDEAARMLAKLADGGMRDALSLLDLVCGEGGEITAQTVRGRIGLISREHLFEIAEAVASGEFGDVMTLLSGLWAKTIDYQRMAEQLVGFYRDLMVAKAVKEPGELIACLPEESERFTELAQGQSLNRIIGWLDTCQEILGKMNRSSQRKVELEAGLLRMTSPAFTPEEAGLAGRLDRVERKLEKTLIAPGSRQEAPAAAPASPPPAPPTEKVETLPFEEWPQVLEQLSRKNKALHGTLVNSKAYVGGDLLLVDAGEGSMFAGMVRGDSYAKESLRAAVEEVTGKRYKLGPYSAERHTVKTKRDKLEEILKQAGEMGVNVERG